MKVTAIYTQKAILSEITLWLGALSLCGAMVYYWQQDGKKKSNIENNRIDTDNFSVDQLLLTSGELELGTDVNLININLNNGIANSLEPPIQGILPERTKNYSKILEYKIKKIAPKEASGFTIKPLPEP